MSTNKALTTTEQDAKPGVIESALVMGDLAKLSTAERVTYYNRTCESLGLNPLTRPFDYITLNGKLMLYARKDATEQLRTLRGISVKLTEKTLTGDIFAVTAEATELKTGRMDSSLGAVSVAGLKGEALANAYMKAETKAKRRVTLSVCGLGLLDETEVETIPNAVTVRAEMIAPTEEEQKALTAKEEKPEPKKPRVDIPLDGVPHVPAPAPTLEAQPAEENKALVFFSQAVRETGTEEGVKSCWETFMQGKPSTEAAGKAWKLRAARLSELRTKGGK